MGGIQTLAGPSRQGATSGGPRACRRKFLRFFRGGFHDEKYHAWERGYKEKAHAQWEEFLSKSAFAALLKAGKFSEIAAHAVRIESRTNLLFSFEKMALRDAVKSPAGARAFAEGLYAFLHGPGRPEAKFDRWCAALATLPRRQTRVLTWPLATIFGFLAQPDVHFFLKPNVTRRAAQQYGYDFRYQSKPTAEIYDGLLAFAETVRQDLADLRPLDQIDIQSFLWVQGSDEYEK
jgi:hypothetical protein